MPFNAMSEFTRFLEITDVDFASSPAYDFCLRRYLEFENAFKHSRGRSSSLYEKMMSYAVLLSQVAALRSGYALSDSMLWEFQGVEIHE